MPIATLEKTIDPAPLADPAPAARAEAATNPYQVSTAVRPSVLRIFASGLGVATPQATGSASDVERAFGIHTWLVTVALPIVLEAGELEDLAASLRAAPRTSADPYNLHEASATVRTALHDLRKSCAATTLSEEAKLWGWDWGTQAHAVRASGLDAAVEAVRRGMSRTSADPIAGLLRLSLLVTDLAAPTQQALATSARTCLARQAGLNHTKVAPRRIEVPASAD